MFVGGSNHSKWLGRERSGHRLGRIATTVDNHRRTEKEAIGKTERDTSSSERGEDKVHQRFGLWGDSNKETK